ncbi:unnamed protein product [Ixodes persulcatus]
MCITQERKNTRQSNLKDHARLYFRQYENHHHKLPLFTLSINLY